MNLTSSEYKVNFSPNGVPDAPAIPEVIDNRPTKVKAGNNEHPAIKSIREGLQSIVKDWVDEVTKIDLVFREITIDQDTVEKTDLNSYKAKSERTFNEFDKALEKGLEYGEVLDPLDILKILKFTLSHMAFASDMSVRAAAFVDFHRLLDSFNEKLVGLTNEKGLIKDIRGGGREKLFKLMMYQGALGFLVQNSKFRVKSKEVHHGLKFGQIYKDAITDFKEKNTDFNQALLNSDSLGKIATLLNRRKVNSTELMDSTNNTPSSQLEKCTLEELLKAKWDNLTGEGSVIGENSLRMHLHIVRNELVRGHEDIIGTPDMEAADVDRVDSSLLDVDNYYEADDLSSFMRASEFMMFNATDGNRSIVNLTTLHFLIQDTETYLTMVELLVSGKDQDPFSAKVEQLRESLFPTFVDEGTYLPLITPKVRESDEVNILEYIVRAYDMLQNDKTAKAFVHNFGIPLVKGFDTRSSYEPLNPISKEFQGKTERTSVQRIAAAKFAAYWVSLLSLPIRNVDVKGKPIPAEKDSEGNEVPFNRAKKVRFRFRVGEEFITKLVRRSNLVIELFKKAAKDLNNNGSAPQVNMGQYRASMTSQERRIPPCFLVFLTARRGVLKNHAAALIGTDDDKISDITLEKDGIERLVKFLTNAHNNPEKGPRNPLIRAGIEMRIYYNLFKGNHDRGGALFKKTDSEPGTPPCDPDISRFGAVASPYLPDLYGVNPVQLAIQDPASRIPLMDTDLSKATQVIDDIHGLLMQIYLNAEKSPVPAIKRLATAGLYHVREAQGLSNSTEKPDEKDPSAAKIVKSVNMVFANTGLFDNLMSVFGKRSEIELQSMFQDKTRPFHKKYADAFEIFFGRFITRVKFKIGSYEDGNSWYLNFAGQKIDQQTLSAGELYGISHLKGRTNEGHVDGYSARLDLDDKATSVAIENTIKYLPRNSIRLFLELFNENLPVRKGWVKAFRFTIDPEYVMAPGYGTTINRRDMGDGTLLAAQLESSVKEIKDKKAALFTDPYTALRIVSEVSKMIDGLIEPDEDDKRFGGDLVKFAKAHKDYTDALKELTDVANFWAGHALNTNVSAHHSLKSAVGSSYASDFVDSEIPLRRVLEKPFMQKGSREWTIWVETVINGITLQVATALTGESLPAASIGLNNHAFDFQRSKVNSNTFYELFLNRDNIYRSMADIMNTNRYPTMESFLRQIFGGPNGAQRVSFLGYQEAANGEGDMVQELSQRIYNTVDNFNQAFWDIGKILREKVKDTDSEVVKKNHQDKQDEARTKLGLLNSNAEKLVAQYPDFFTLRNKTKIERSSPIEVNELEVLIPTGFLHPMHGDLMKPHKPNSTQTFAGLLNFYDGDDYQIYGNQNIAISKFLRGFVQAISEIKRTTEVDISTQIKSGDLSHGEAGNVSPLRILTEVVKKAKEWETGGITDKKGIEMRDALFVERLGIPYKLFLRDVMYSMNVTPKEIIAEINKWRELSMKENKQLRDVIGEGLDKAVAQTPAREFMKPLRAIGGFIVKIAVPINNSFRAGIAQRYLAAGGIISAGSIAVGSVIAATSGTVLLPFVGIPAIAFIAGHLVTSLASYGVNICMRDFAIYGPEGNEHRGRPARTLIKIANNTFKNLPFWRERYARYNKEREVKSSLEKLGLGKSQVVKESFEPSKVATLFGLTVNQLPKDLLSALVWLKDNIEDIPGGISVPEVEKPQEEKALQAGK